MNVQISNKQGLFYLIVFLLTGFAMSVADGYLKNSITPFGIISYELIYDIDLVEKAKSLWGEQGKIAAAFSLGIDYLFLLSYAVIGLWVIQNTQNKLTTLAPTVSRPLTFVAFLVVIAALCDVIENTALVSLLFDSAQPTLAFTAYYFAIAKFSALLMSIIAVIAANIFYLFRRKK